jgi:S1-C subfamily serine protease
MKAAFAILLLILMPTLVRAQSTDDIIDVRQLASHVMQVNAETLGTAVALSENLAVTNCHVLGTASSARVARGSLTSTASLKTGDTGRDLCLLELEASPSFAAKLGRAASLSVGDRVYAVGFGAGRLSIGIGKIEALYPYDGSFIVRTDAPFALGASGGALFDSKHHLVGVLTFFRRGVRGASYWAMPVEWVDALRHSNSATVNRSRLPLWSKEESASIRFLQVAGYEIDGDWLKMAQIARLWVAEEPGNEEAIRAFQFANSMFGGPSKSGPVGGHPNE